MKVLESISLPTKYGIFNMIAIDSGIVDFPHLILADPNLDISKAVTVRIHSECMTGDVFGSSRCDCGDQLEFSMQQAINDSGVVLYLRQEGRGIGLINKMKAYNLQDQGLDTFEANVKLGFHQDMRDFTIAIDMLEYLKISKIKLLTNNPEKLGVFKDSSIEVTERLPIEIPANETNQKYLEAKKDVMGHLLDNL